MDLRDQLDAEMTHNEGTGPGSISRYPVPQRSGDETTEGIPQDKLGIGSPDLQGKTGEASLREDSQEVKEMYDKFMGSPGETDNPYGGQTRQSKLNAVASAGTSSLLRYGDDGHNSTHHGQDESISLIHNPTINQ